MMLHRVINSFQMKTMKIKNISLVDGYIYRHLWNMITLVCIVHIVKATTAMFISPVQELDTQLHSCRERSMSITNPYIKLLNLHL